MVLEKEMLELCWKIEELDASELQTEISVRAGEIKDKVKFLLVKEEALTRIVTQLKVDLDTLQEENERLKRLESAVMAWSKAKKVGTMEQVDFDLCRILVNLGMEGFLRFFRREGATDEI
jgi:hypothetical protein